MYEIFSRLLEERGVKAADVCRGTGLPSSLFSEWKRGKSTPKADKIKKIADYFGVTADYLRTGKEESEKEEFGKEGSEITAREKRLMEYARQLLDMGITPDDLESLIDIAQKMGKKD